MPAALAASAAAAAATKAAATAKAAASAAARGLGKLLAALATRAPPPPTLPSPTRPAACAEPVSVAGAGSDDGLFFPLGGHSDDPGFGAEFCPDGYPEAGPCGAWEEWASESGGQDTHDGLHAACDGAEAPGWGAPTRRRSTPPGGASTAFDNERGTGARAAGRVTWAVWWPAARLAGRRRSVPRRPAGGALLKTGRRPRRRPRRRRAGSRPSRRTRWCGGDRMPPPRGHTPPKRRRAEARRRAPRLGGLSRAHTRATGRSQTPRPAARRRPASGRASDPARPLRGRPRRRPRAGGRSPPLHVFSASTCRPCRRRPIRASGWSDVARVCPFGRPLCVRRRQRWRSGGERRRCRERRDHRRGGEAGGGRQRCRHCGWGLCPTGGRSCTRGRRSCLCQHAARRCRGGTRRWWPTPRWRWWPARPKCAAFLCLFGGQRAWKRRRWDLIRRRLPPRGFADKHASAAAGMRRRAGHHQGGGTASCGPSGGGGCSAVLFLPVCFSSGECEGESVKRAGRGCLRGGRQLF